MVIARISIEENLSMVLVVAQDGLKHLAAPMALIANHLLRATEDRFRGEHGPDGVPWKKSRRVLEEGGRTLYESGDLFDALDKRSGDDFAEAGVEASAGAAVYARIHQYGGEIRPVRARALSFGGRMVAKVTMPARPYLGFDDTDETEITAIMREHVERLFQGGSNGSEARVA